MRLTVTLTLAFVLALALAPPSPALAATPASQADLDSLSLDNVLSSAGKNAGSVVGQVDRIAFGSQGATVTLEGGKQVRLDFSGLTGVSGGPNYLGWAMLLFGASVAARLLSSVARILRPLSAARRRRRRDHDDW